MEIESGLLVISVHSLRQALEKYRVLLAPGERQSLVEDLDEIESEAYDVEQKLRTIERIYRTQPSLLKPGAVPGQAARSGTRGEHRVAYLCDLTRVELGGVDGHGLADVI